MVVILSSTEYINYIDNSCIFLIPRTTELQTYSSGKCVGIIDSRACSGTVCVQMYRQVETLML
jgi:hypothetical protein